MSSIAQLPYLLILFSLGTAVGSFLNVVSRRLLRGEPITGHSRCEACRRPLSATDLIPLLSFFLLRGHCRHCGAKLSIQYPLVEGGAGVLFAVLSWRTFSELGLNLPSFLANLLLLVTTSALIVVFVTDLLEQRVFDQVILVGLASTLPYRFLISENIVRDLIAAFVVFLFFWILRLATRGRGMGEGDPPLGFLVALLTGFPQGLVMLFLAFTTGAIVGLVLVLTKRRRFGEQIPFGPFLVVATFATLFVGNLILDWYLRLLGI